MRSVGGRNSEGSGALECICQGLRLVARIVGASSVQHQSLEKTASSPCTAKISVKQIGQRRNLKFAAITLLLLSNLRLCPLHIFCWLGDYPLHFTCGDVDSPSHVVLSLLSICEKETAVQDPSKVLPLPFRPLYHKKTPSSSGDTSSKMFCINSSPITGTTSFLRRCLSVEQKGREMTSKWVLDLAHFEL